MRGDRAEMISSLSTAGTTKSQRRWLLVSRALRTKRPPALVALSLKFVCELGFDDVIQQADEVMTEGIKPNFEQGTVEACRGTLGARSSSTTFRLSRLTPFTSGCVLLISARLSECRGFPVQVLSQQNGSLVLPLIVTHLSR